MNNPENIIKIVSATLVGMGTSRIVRGVVRNNVPTDKVIDKITVGGAEVVIGAMAGAATKAYSDKLVDETIEAVKALRDSLKQSD